MLPLLILSAAAAWAHPLDLALLRIKALDEALHIRLELNPAAVATILGISKAGLPASLDPHTQSFFSETLGGGEISLDGRPCVWSKQIVARQESEFIVSLSTQAICHSLRGRLRLTLPFISKESELFRVVYYVDMGAGDILGDLIPERPDLELDLSLADPGFFGLVRLGVEHLGATPSQWRNADGFRLPAGLDHMFFLLALLLGGASLWQLFKAISGFTLGHSLALGLAAFQIFQVSSRWVEVAIALSIAAVAFENLRWQKMRGRRRHRFLLIVALGFVHGLGFATALTNFNLSGWALFKAVLGFNMGVELGQLIVIAFAMPILWLLARKPWSYFIAYRITSLALLGIALYWTFSRLLVSS